MNIRKQVHWERSRNQPPQRTPARSGDAQAMRSVARFVLSPPRSTPTPAERDPQPVRRLAVHDVLRSQGSPLTQPVRADMETRLGADFSTVRIHANSTAQRSADELGARAYTVGENVVFGAGGMAPHLLAHELAHVIQQRQGPVAGTEHEGGVRVSDAADAFERAAEVTARRVMSRPVPASRPVAAAGPVTSGNAYVQRYVLVTPGEASYPVSGTRDEQDRRGPAGEKFFPRQEESDDSYVNAEGEINLRYQGAVPLRIATKRDLAVEDSRSQGNQIQAKAFFATDKRIRQANKKLQGSVRFARAQSGNFLELKRSRRVLKLRFGTETLTLWQVDPVVTRESFVENKTITTRGLDVRTAQRCDEMATAVSRRYALPAEGDIRYFDAIGDVLGELTTRSSSDRKLRLNNARAAVSTSGSDEAISAYTDVLSSMLQEIIGLRDAEDPAQQYTAAVRKFGLNEFTPPPRIGDVLMIKALKKDSTSGELDFHFAGVIARSGEDYITMENFARHEAQDTLSSGDPQWYFQMYGTKDPVQSWHEEWGWAHSFPERFVLSIRLSG